MLNKLKLIFAILRGGDTMALVDVYVALIIGKVRTIDQVPKHLQPSVLATLKALGLDGNGDLLGA